MQIKLYLKNHPDGTPWKFWGIGIQDKVVMTFFGPYNDQIILSNRREVDRNGQLDAIVAGQRIDQKVKEGYKPYLDSDYDIDDDGKAIPVITNAEEAILFGKPLIYYTGNVDLSYDIFQLGNQLKMIQSVDRNNISLTLQEDDCEDFVIKFIQTQNGTYKVAGNVLNNHPKKAGLFLLYLNKSIIEFGAEPIKFANAASKDVAVNYKRIDSEVEKLFNFKDYESFNADAETLGLVKTWKSSKSIDNSFVSAF